MSESQIFQLLLNRRTIQDFVSGEPVPRRVLEAAIEVAHHAPNHKLTLPWRFYVLGEKSRGAIAEIAVSLKEKVDGPLSPAVAAAIGKKFFDPGIVLVVTCIRSPDPLRAREDYAAVACALQNMSVYLWDAGYGTKWGTGPATRDSRTYAALGISDETEEIVGFFYIGKSARHPPRPARPPYQKFLQDLP